MDFELIKSHILNHGIIGFKTDTVMGIGVNGLDRIAVENIFELKNRSFDKPLYLLCYSLNQILKYTCSIPDYAYELMSKKFPGPFTFIFYSTKTIWTTPIEQGNTIGVRIPDFKPLLDLLSVIDLPILNTSANISGMPPFKNDKEIKIFFGNDVLYVPFEYNISMSNVPSTIVDCTGEKPVILRKGASKYYENIDIW